MYHIVLIKLWIVFWVAFLSFLLILRDSGICMLGTEVPVFHTEKIMFSLVCRLMFLWDMWRSDDFVK